MNIKKLRYFWSNLNFFFSELPFRHITYPFICHPGDEEWALQRAQLQELPQGTTQMKNERFMPDCSERALYSVQISQSQIQRLAVHCDVADIEQTAVRRTGKHRIRKSNYRTWHQALRLRASATCFTSLASSLKSYRMKSQWQHHVSNLNLKNVNIFEIITSIVPSVTS
jgi:hypothetical protein